MVALVASAAACGGDGTEDTSSGSTRASTGMTSSAATTTGSSVSSSDVGSSAGGASPGGGGPGGAGGDLAAGGRDPGAGGAGGGGGQGQVGAPRDWSCLPAFFGDGEACDCGCGAPDPDCGVATVIFGCGAPHRPGEGVACEEDGRCAVPDGWRCDADAFGDATTCDCACGVPDADCFPAGLPVVGCTFGSVCVGDVCAPIPSQWSCDDAHYAAADGCDCDCGARDPDCDDAQAIIFGCGEGHAPGDGQACRPDGSCAAPEGWACEEVAYDDGDLCHCDCGAPDVDCLVDLRLPVDGCADEERCPDDGCLPIPPGDLCATALDVGEGSHPSTWMSAVGDYDAGGACGLSGAPGRDVAFRVSLSAGQRIVATVPANAADPSLYLVRSCDDVAGTCVKGADSGSTGESETLDYTATEAEQLFLVVDQYGDTVGTDFVVLIDLTP